MTMWAVDPQTGQGVALNDAAAQEAAAEGWHVYPYQNQDAGLSGLGYDPNAAAGHQILGDQVLVFNSQTQRYEWMSRALVDAQNAATAAYGAETQRAATTADIIAASRGPENAFQYSNALHGQPDASGVGIFDALAGRLGGATTAGTPQQGDLHPIDIMGRVQAILNRSFGTGGANGSGSSAWAEQAGMAPTQTEQRAQGAVQAAAQTQQAGQQGASQPAGVSHGAGTAPGPLAASGGAAYPGGQPGQVYSPEMGRYVDARGPAYTPNPMGRADAQMVRPMTVYGPSQAVFDPFSGKVDTGAYERASGLSGHGDSDIAWKNKSHQLIEGRGYGHGSDARNAAHQAAGMTGEQFDRIVKHGGDPFKQVHAAQGMADVVTGPTTIHAGEGGKDELHVVIPLERADQPVPQAILALANMLSPDKDGQRGAGNDPEHHMAAGGGLAVIGGATTVTPANGPVNAAGQVRVPQGRKTRMVPASQTTPMPDFGALPPALLSLIGPSDWKLIGSEYGTLGGNAEDIPWLLKRGTQGLGRAPGAFGGRVF